MEVMNIIDIKNNEITPKTVVKFIEDYESTHSEEVWNNEVEKIYSTGGETLYQFRGKYYKR
ncbi:unknown [Clostridium sp. CAG:921]|nr:unknown [Clostridium sp. CAG:921]